MAKPELLNHPKFGRLLRALKVPPYVGVGILETLWQRCYATTDDVVESAADLAWAIGWDAADADRLADSLVAAGFLDPEGSRGFRVHNLFRHAPLYVRRRLGQNRALLGVTTRTEPNRTPEQEEQDAPRPTHPVENVEPALPFDEPRSNTIGSYDDVPRGTIRSTRASSGASRTNSSTSRTRTTATSRRR